MSLWGFGALAENICEPGALFNNVEPGNTD